MAEEMLTEAEVDAEVMRIEEELDSQPGYVDFDRLGKTMVILGTIFFVSYMALFILSFFGKASDSWSPFEFWSVGQFLVVTISCIAMILIGYMMTSDRSIPSN